MFCIVQHIALLCTLLVFANATDQNINAYQESIEPKPDPSSCVVNLCFAIDGSASISDAQYNQQKSFVASVVKKLTKENKAGFAAVQYGVANIAISPFTEDETEFLQLVETSERKGATQTFVLSGINYCFSQLFRRTGALNSIVMLGDGERNFGGDPVDRADLFRETGGEVSAVAIGASPNVAALKAIAGKRTSKFFRIKNLNAVERAAEDFAKTICTG